MNYIGLLTLTLILPAARAQSCAPTSKEMAQYSLQQNWQARQLTGAEGVAPVNGYADDRGAFYFNDLSRGGTAPAVVEVESGNKSYRDFFKYCKAGKAAYLRAMRRSGEGNVYHVSMRYLPSFKELANDPIKDQGYTDKASLKLKFESGASLDALESYPDKIKAELYRTLNKQLSEQSEFGLLELDLSGWDDVVCDLIQGKVRMWVSRDGISKAPRVTQQVEVQPADLRNLHSALKNNVPSNQGKERAIFAGARTLSRLEVERKVSAWDERKAFDILKKMMNTDMSAVIDADESTLSCLADQLQTYSRPHVSHFINVELKTRSLDEIEGKQ